MYNSTNRMFISKPVQLTVKKINNNLSNTRNMYKQYLMVELDKQCCVFT